MDRPTYNFAAAAASTLAETARGRRAIVPTEKVVHAKRMEAEKAAKKAQKTAKTRRKPTKAFEDQNTAITARSPIAQPGLNQAEPPLGSVPGAVFNASFQAQVPAQPLQLPQPFPYMTLSEQQLAHLGAMYAQNHWPGLPGQAQGPFGGSSASAPLSHGVGVGVGARSHDGSSSNSVNNGNYHMGPASFESEELLEIDNDPDADAHSSQSESEELQQMRSITSDENLFNINIPEDMSRAFSGTAEPQAGHNSATFSFQFPQAVSDIEPPAQPPAQQLAVNTADPAVAVAPPQESDDEDDDNEDDDDGDSSDDESGDGKKRKKRGFNSLGLSAIELHASRLACKLYALDIMTKDAWPDVPAPPSNNSAQPTQPADTNIRERLAVQKWFEARDIVQERTGLDLSGIEPTLEVIRLIKGRDSWARCRFKKAAAENIASHFGLRAKPDSKGREALTNLIIQNREKVINLKTNDSYIFQDPTDLDKPGTIYRHPLLEEVIVKALFNNGSKSIAFAPRSIIGESDLMPLATIALASVAVECALDEYYKGVPKKIPFQGAVYCKVYRHHIRQLNLWKEHQPESLAGFQREYLTDVKLTALGNDDPAHAVGERVDVPVARFS